MHALLSAAQQTAEEWQYRSGTAAPQAACSGDARTIHHFRRVSVVIREDAHTSVLRLTSAFSRSSRLLEWI